MKFDNPATTNPIDQLKVVGKPTDRIDGPLKTTGTAPYAYERNDVGAQPGLWLCGRLGHRQRPHRLDRSDQGQGRGRRARHRHRGQCRQARQGQTTTPRSSSAVRRSSTITRRSPSSSRRPSSRPAPPAQLMRVNYVRAEGRYDLAAAKDTAIKPERITGGPPDTAVGDFAGAFAAAPVQLDATYTTPDQAHAMMEPHASIAAWNGRQADAVDLQPDDRLERRRHGEDARHSQGERPPASRPISAAASAGSCSSAPMRCSRRSARAPPAGR